MGNEFLVLANSRKNDGRCLAGILNPYSKKNRWVRLVSDTSGAALNGKVSVKNHGILSGLNPLDVIEVELGSSCPLPEQPENIILDTSKSIVYKKTETIGFINQFLENPENIWGTDSISESSHSGSSLMLLPVNNPKKDKTYKNLPSLNFKYNGINYNIRCTMENFLQFPMPDNLRRCIICVSSGTEYSGAHYKFVASVII